LEPIGKVSLSARLTPSAAAVLALPGAAAMIAAPAMTAMAAVMARAPERGPGRGPERGCIISLPSAAGHRGVAIDRGIAAAGYRIVEQRVLDKDDNVDDPTVGVDEEEDEKVPPPDELDEEELEDDELEDDELLA
jgi:hypothetical protein